MSNILEKFNITSIILLIFLIICFPNQIFSQEIEAETEILVYILPDSLEMPDGITELTDVKELKINSKKLGEEIKK